jgi:hypothetical protein
MCLNIIGARVIMANVENMDSATSIFNLVFIFYLPPEDVLKSVEIEVAVSLPFVVKQ